MFTKTLFWTSLIAGLSMSVGLLFLKLFNFISWSPIGWANRINLFNALHYTIKWSLLFIVLAIFFAFIYIIVSFTSSIPQSITSIIVAALIVILIDWRIHPSNTVLETLKISNIPFFAMMAITTRFITGTAVFMKKLSLESMK